MSTRRDFLLDSCRFCFLIATAGAGMTLIDGCKTTKTVTGTTTDDKKLKIPLSSFSSHPHVLVRQPNSDNMIFAEKKSDGTYEALSMVCTHKGQPLTLQNNQLYCSTHGSTFDFDGNVTHGPAARSLKSYPVSATDTDLLIDVNG